MQTKARIGSSLGLLVASKLVNIQVPFMFKEIIDTYTAIPDPTIAIPFAMVVGYGVARSTAALCQV